jgi:chromate transporter
MPVLLSLFLTFAKIGLFTFGGGYAMLSIIENICVERKRWITHEEMMDITVIAESTPGPIAINCATFTGYKQAGVPGAIAATLGVITPAWIIILLIAMGLEYVLHYPVVANAFAGIQVAVCLLIVRAGWTMIQKMLKKSKAKAVQAAICTVSCAALVMIELFDLSFSSIWMLVIGGVLGWLLFHQIKIDKKGGSAK